MQWEKKGLIYSVDGSRNWAQTHASVPTVDVRADGRWRLYYASRDAQNRCRIGFFDVAAGQPERILADSAEPMLELGKLGTFDDCGMMPSWIVTLGGRKYLYYIGWTVRNTIPYHNSIGLLVSDDDGATFQRFSDGPIFSPTYREPYFTGTSCVFVEDGLWRNWYMSCTGWTDVDGRAEPHYHLKYAESTNGIDWQRDGRVAIDYADSHEAGIVRASVLRTAEGWSMWYSHRNLIGYRQDPTQSYRIGFATSTDGRTWQRRDAEAGIDVSPEGWDGVMVTYPCVVRHEDKLYMFYNGNGFGRTGIGYAVAEAP